jgi:hydrogenase nickel incorporation protein HypB
VFGFNLDAVRERAKKRNSTVTVIHISARTGEGIDVWVQWLHEQVKEWNSKI